MLRPVVGATVLVVSLVAATAVAAPTVTFMPGQGDSINEDGEPVILANRHRLARIFIEPDPTQFLHPVVLPAVNSNKIYLNDCKPNGCVIQTGGVSSLDGTGFQGRWNINQPDTLTPWNQSDVLWQEVVDCMRDVFSPFGVEIVTDNPSPAQHFEIMIAGRSTDINGFDANWLGVSPSACNYPADYIPNSLVFAFANSPAYVGESEEICATAAQEIAHSFALDHTVDASDPLTYFGFAGRKRFKNAAVQCGSDCVNGTSPGGDTCTGGGLNKQIHPCICTGQTTQNSFSVITGLFGAGSPTPPTVMFVNPMANSNVEPGFGFSVTAEDNSGVAKVQAFIDQVSVGLLNSPPYAFNGPATLTGGQHTIRVVATDIFGVTGEASRNVYVGAKCEGTDDCPNDTDACIGGRCVAGPGVADGLGVTCDVAPDCASELCASDKDGEKHCVEPCNEGDCPSGFGCLPAPSEGYTGVCWPGFEDGSGGGCNTTGKGGAFGCAFALGALLLARRRRVESNA